MRNRLGLLALVCLAGLARADGPAAPDGGSPGTSIEVEVENLVGVQGRILMSLHTGTDTFPGKSAQAWRHEWVKVTSNPFHYRFEHVPPGEYAVGAAHDSNDNGKIDTGIFGIPVEGLGVSNNPFSIGPPSFDAARFKVGTAPVKLVIHVRR